MSISIVTAYVPLKTSHRSEAEFHRLGHQLLDSDLPIMFMHDKLEKCWLHQYAGWCGRKLTHSISDDPEKNTLAYHCVMAQKTDWLVDAACFNQEPEVLVWIDYGIFHVPGITIEIIKNFLLRAMDERCIAIPGCWEKNYLYDDEHPCWRFCGGVMVIPRKFVFEFDMAMKQEYIRWIHETGNVSWEVNTLARLERRHELPIWHYRADHNESMFQNYRVPEYSRERQLSLH
jgi:hypothetical protein